MSDFPLGAPEHYECDPYGKARIVGGPTTADLQAQNQFLAAKLDKIERQLEELMASIATLGAHLNLKPKAGE